MSDPRAAAFLAHAADLQGRDDAAAARIGAVADLLRRADQLRGRATALAASLSALPAERAQLDDAEAAARLREAAARRELAEAERRVEELERSRRSGDQAKSQARRELNTARQALADAGAGIDRIVARRGSLLGEERAWRAEADGLAAAAREVAAAIGETSGVSASGRTEPGTTLAALEEWGARAHAALFVVRHGLEEERERIVNEANALGASLLGEELGGSSVASVRRRLEEAFA